MAGEYSAGLIDGEGYIGIQKSGGSWQVRLKVSMTDKGLPALRALQRMHGGKIYGPQRPQNARARESYTWPLIGSAATSLIRELQPLLLVKAEPARIALEFQQMVDASPRLPNGRASWTPEMRERAAMLTARIQEANRRGPDPAPPTLPTALTPLAVYRWGWWWEPNETLFGPVEWDGRMPPCGMVLSGHLYELPTPEIPPLPEVPPGLLLPTPVTQPNTGNGHARDLGGEVRVLLPTPAASDGTGGRVSAELGGTRPSGAKRSVTLATALAHLLPTPTASDHTGPGTHGDGGMDLRTAVSLLPDCSPPPEPVTEPKEDRGSGDLPVT